MLFVTFLLALAGYILVYAGIKNTSVKSILLRSVNPNVTREHIS